jgi:DNA-binding HxlR family transcriptional regulator
VNYAAGSQARNVARKAEARVTDISYSQFCPVAMAAEVLGTRWTLLLLRELVSGSTRFNDLRRGVPRMSPALLSKRLKELEAAAVIERVPVANEPGIFEYRLTEAGRELKPVIEAIGCWGQRWIDLEVSLEKLDPGLLMWDMRRNIDPRPMPRTRSTIQVIFSDLPEGRRNWWLVVEPGKDVDLCSVDPGFDVDLYLSTDLRTMTEIWMGYTAISRAKEQGRLLITGSRQLEADLGAWLSLSPFARVEKRVA